MLRRHLLLGTLVCGVTIACTDSLGPPSVWDNLSVTADRLLYLPGDRVVVTTQNRTGRLVFCDHCQGEVQGLELLGEWNGSYGVFRGCSWSLGGPAEILIAIEPGERHVDTLHINTEAYTGNWRAVLRFEDEEGAETFYATPRFRVLGTWKP